MKEKSKNKEYKSLISALAFGSTDSAQSILQENGVEPAQTYEELEYKLAKVYAKSDDKIGLEKKFAEIHPHSKFILKYLAKPEKKVEVEKPTEEIKVIEPSSSANSQFMCNCPLCREAMSNFDSAEKKEVKIDYTSIAIVGIVAIFGMIYLSKK